MNNIAKERQALGITQEYLASLFGWRQSRIANYENGSRKPALSDCRLIVGKLNSLGSSCTLDTVFPPEPEKREPSCNLQISDSSIR